MKIAELKQQMQKEQMYLEAKNRNPGKELTPCGVGPTLADGFAVYEDVATILFYYNVGPDTFAVKREI